jgi:hypothetical protein
MQNTNNKGEILAFMVKKLIRTSEEMPLERNIVIWEGEREEKEILIQKVWLDDGDDNLIVFLSSEGVRFYPEDLGIKSLSLISQSI